MKIEDIQMQASMHQLEQADLNEEQIASARATIEQIAEVMKEYGEALNHIVANKMLSVAGKAHDTADLKTNTDNRLAQIANPRLESLDKRIPELEFETRPQNPDSDATTELLKQQEVRSMLATHQDYQDELQLTAFYQALAISGQNDLAMRAIEQSPLPMINDPSILEDGIRARGTRQSPDSAKALKQLRAVRAAIRDSLGTARASLNMPDLTLVTLAETGGL